MNLRISTLFILLGSLGFIIFAQTKNSISGDRQALMDLYNATNGPNWKNNAGWGSGDPSNTWHGVEVNSNGRVVRLDLFDNGLDGQLPASIGNLTKLTYLGLKQNQLTGILPSEIGNLTALKVLALAGRYDNGSEGVIMKDFYSYEEAKGKNRGWNQYYHAGKRPEATNQFTGAIPGTIGNLTNLEILEISGQRDSNFGPGLPPEIGNCTSLMGLYANKNKGFTDPLPSSLSNLTNLRHLYMTNNQLTGEIPDISRMTEMRYINLGSNSQVSEDNHLTGNVPDFRAMKKIKGVEFDKNNLTGPLPSYLNDGTHTALDWYRFSWNDLEGEVHDFDNLPNTVSIGISGNNLTGGVDWLTTIDSGTIIIAAGWNNFSGELPQSGYPTWHRLRNLYLNDNSLAGHIPCALWEAVGESNKLLRIYFDDNEFDSNAASCMNNNIDNSVEVKLYGNNF